MNIKTTKRHLEANTNSTVYHVETSYINSKWH